ncbi:sarcosine oxidase subunit gamma [Paenarthrobacter sp. Z7-10]|uniref:sarcosine oxidase subunit gamma n=1 Tax=Paenarthrobacter sp. Z7-10 TaxID=2787635 RepID=UPI0022A97628|nr:sarcosine oxidase subunit gamma family protein [Paenarthrobacter sp. Z7-10]MCZ2404039.1 sarcosine oxidase subunit gamma [Paenarthrobacter sp. Z7-10]
MAETAERESAVIRGLRRSPVAHLAEEFAQGSVEGAHGVALREVPFLTMVGLRVNPASAAGERVGAVAGGLPNSCGQVGGAADGSGTGTLWLGPQEFLVVAPEDVADDGGPAALVSALQQALGQDAGQAVDLSANRTTFELAGPSAREVLEKSCALDLHPRVFKPGTAYVTEIGLIPALLWKVDVQTYRIFPRASFADFLGRWLLDGMQEFNAAQVS